MKKVWFAYLGLMLISTFAFGQAKDFPNRPVKVIVPFTPGSGSDTAARFFGEKLAGVLGQPFIVENRPGASGVVAVMAVKSAPADGYTILLAANSPLSVNPVTIKDLPYDPLKDLRPLGGLTRGMAVFFVPGNSKLNSLADLVAMAKKETKPPAVGTYSAGYQLMMEWLASLGGVKLMNVPYKGGAQVFADAMGGQLDVGIADLGGVAALLKSGKLRPLAVTGEIRHPDFPEVPTIRESGYPEYAAYNWTSFGVRAETPDDVTAKLADALQKVLATNEAREYVARSLLDLLPLPPAAMQQFQQDEIARWRRIAAAAGIKPQ